MKAWILRRRRERTLLLQLRDVSTATGDLVRVMRVDAAKQRWRVERDYQELEQEVRFGHKGRGSRGCHHHATLCIAAYGIPDLRKGGDFLLQYFVAPHCPLDRPHSRKACSVVKREAIRPAQVDQVSGNGPDAPMPPYGT